MNAAPAAASGMRLAAWLAMLIAACVLPLVSVAGWLAYEEVAARQDEREREGAARARNVATSIDDWLRARIGALQMLAGSPQLAGNMDLGAFHREASRFPPAFGSQVLVAAANGPGHPWRMLLNTRVPPGEALPPMPQPQGRAAVVLAQQSGLPAVGDLVVGPVAGEALVALAVPVPAVPPQRAEAGLVLLTTPTAKQLQQRLEQVALPPDWALSLLDSRGDVIARRAPAGFVAAPEGVRAGRHRVALDAAAWTVQLEIAPPVRAAPARQAALALGVIVAAATLLAVGAGLLAARRLRRAVAMLADPADGHPAGIAEIDQARRRLDAAAARRAQAQAAERAAEERLRATFELARVGIAHVGLDGRWLRVNRRLCEILGRTEAELLAEAWETVTAPDDQASGPAHRRRLLAGESPVCDWDQRCLRGDGREVWVALSVALVRDAAGAPDYFITVLEDIDARKRLEQRNREQIDALEQAEKQGRSLLALAERSRAALLNVLDDAQRAAQALRESEARMRNLFEHLADGVLLVDAEGRIEDANPSAESMFGCAPGELAAVPMSSLLAEPIDRERWAQELPGLQSAQAGLSEWEMQRRDGTRFPAELSAKPLDARRVVAVLRDIGARRAAEQALLHYQAELSDLAQRLMAQERTTTRRVAQALHDRLGQTLAAARLRVGALDLHRGGDAAAVRADALPALERLLEQAVAETRQVLSELRPPLLEDQGLAAALDNEFRRPDPAGAPAAVPALAATPSAQAQRWPAEVEYAAFMVAREAVANAAQHAQARHIVVALDGGPKGLELVVDDDGIGLAPALAKGRPGHLGIVGMRERALAIGARFAVVPRPKGGTRVKLSWGECRA